MTTNTNTTATVYRATVDITGAGTVLTATGSAGFNYNYMVAARRTTTQVWEALGLYLTRKEALDRACGARHTYRIAEDGDTREWDFDNVLVLPAVPESDEEVTRIRLRSTVDALEVDQMELEGRIQQTDELEARLAALSAEVVSLKERNEYLGKRNEELVNRTDALANQQRQMVARLTSPMEVRRRVLEALVAEKNGLDESDVDLYDEQVEELFDRLVELVKLDHDDVWAAERDFNVQVTFSVTVDMRVRARCESDVRKMVHGTAFEFEANLDGDLDGDAVHAEVVDAALECVRIEENC